MIDNTGGRGVFGDLDCSKTLQLIARRFAFVYCRIEYELDWSNRHAIVLQIWSNII